MICEVHFFLFSQAPGQAIDVEAFRDSLQLVRMAGTVASRTSNKGATIRRFIPTRSPRYRGDISSWDGLLLISRVL